MIRKYSLPIVWISLLVYVGYVFHAAPGYIIPSPHSVFVSLSNNASLLWFHTTATLLETLLGLFLSIAFGFSFAIIVYQYKSLRQSFFSLLIISQALPSLAIAPLIVLWVGYGLASKILLVVLMLFFPITSAFYDGLHRTPREWVDMGVTMGATPSTLLWRIRVPQALPALASGIRIAIAYAPVSALVGEWVGADRGLGYLMLMANAQLRSDLLFSVLFIMVTFSLGLYFLFDRIQKRYLTW